MHPKLQTLNHFDGKKDQFNFQTFIFDSFWDTVLKYCQIFKKKRKKKKTWKWVTGPFFKNISWKVFDMWSKSNHFGCSHFLRSRRTLGWFETARWILTLYIQFTVFYRIVSLIFWQAHDNIILVLAYLHVD